ncbi:MULTISPECIES: type I phosphomannose isomerase catalytic subunit [unclassified Flavobacterium]|uniref:type I phosphomannose isomerase catalytic subunit n=1 Tax=unclassified Flavobacterium TaxID=196869 RepID=UPI001F12F7B1|nr:MULTISPECIES: type I phosphomannose isomerase catalytic subunit [unclassified Flavobacterium]UMY65629.1 class I mannose-6-phosphate isomerase [Flavobacterium sp. HJ-32-4]
MALPLYPLTFAPILKERIWGGEKLRTYLHKPIESAITGESWELSAVKGDVSVVADGPLAGQPLDALIAERPDDLLGTKVHARFGAEFPLLFKYLDAREDLSIQVHPNDELAKARHNSFGKTEMWYVMQADPGARIIVGFKEKSSPEAYLNSLKHNSILDLLDTRTAHKGDVFFLNTGTVHAIGAGLVIAEIQQTSDITYRIYDFDRTDAHGNRRELHVEQALDAINYDKTEALRTYDTKPNVANTMVDCPYFQTNFLPLDGQLDVSKSGDSFTVYMCTEGAFSITVDGNEYPYTMGNTVLLPAALTDFRLSGTATLLEISVP